ncbi:hypothetical protein KEJ26_05395 [Candidatus Bathyarchaeota archaeon]|nr:hypothetical protein [Candidatus Bathyarchaeota archaeon]
MEIQEKRVVASLIFLVGLTLLVLGFHFGQVTDIVRFLKTTFEATTAGIP